MAKKQGSIPEKLSLYSRAPSDVRWSWDDVEGGERTEKVRSVFITDTANKKTQETAKVWQETNMLGYDYDDVSKTYTRKKVDRSEFITAHDIPNVPIHNIRIVTLEIRGQGGRAYKCVADIGPIKDAYFDMREDVLLDCMFQQGISPGGILQGPFIFARVDTDMKPIRVGSLLHDKMIESTEYNQKSTIKSFEIGNVYEDKAGNKFAYIGTGYTRDCKKLEYMFRPRNWESAAHTQWGRAKCIITETPTSDVGYDADGLGKSELHHVFIGCRDKAPEWAQLKYYQSMHSIEFSLKIVKKPSFKECIGKIEVEQGLIDKAFKERNFVYSDSKVCNLSKTQGFINPKFANVPLA